MPFEKWVRPTFTDRDKLVNGSIACGDCLFWFEERSDELARRMGKEKPQRMRNYSQFLVGGEWIPLSKGNKADMIGILLSSPFPELAVVAASGQKHLVFRAPRNPAGATTGWIQFEEQSFYLYPHELAQMLSSILPLLDGGFSKAEIESGQYKQYRVLDFGVERLFRFESQIGPARGTILFALAIFLAQKEMDYDTIARAGGRPARDNLARSTGGLQEPLSDEHLAAVREQYPGGGVHQQPGEIRQLALF